MTDVKAFLYEICIPAIGALCFLAAVLNIAVFISRFHVKSRSATLELTYSLALSDTWTSLVIAISLCWNSYKPVVLQIPNNSYCFPLTLEIVIFFIWAVPPLALIIYFSSWPGQGYRNEACINKSFYENFYFRAQISLIIIVLMITTTVLYWKMLSEVSEVSKLVRCRIQNVLRKIFKVVPQNPKFPLTILFSCQNRTLVQAYSICPSLPFHLVGPYYFCPSSRTLLFLH
ncbi:unnamed protein product [Haemonchus placei]|uniref:G_PROTEIN_RECEP_F1_2 domain-containing protein n=1 Tax=Haemonchus placei TaxID=6290 RepID=A0A0N4WQD4_HAEPC|nr:unnamed protein product [Haemonchus placei]